MVDQGGGMGKDWVRRPNLGVPLPRRCEGGESVGVGVGELGTSEELLMVVSPRGEGLSG